MAQPVFIGVSSCFLYPDENRVVHGPKTLAYFEQDMAVYLKRPGILPVLLPQLPLQELKDFFPHLSGVVFQGGTDLAPETYGEKPIGRWKGDPKRDEYDLRLMQLALDAKLPVFAICRGFQVMNVFFGGTLYQDIETQRPDCQQHRDAAAYDRLFHEIEFLENSFLSSVYPTANKPKVNTVHHQGIKDLGKDLQIDARSLPDGIAEAISYTGFSDSRFFGVQWHPEFSETLKGIVLDPNPLYDFFLSKINR